MSLKSQLILFIVALLTLVLGATFWLNLDSTRSFLQNQLEVHAQDTATSLGITLSHAAEPDDLPMMETFINAVFDRGYYLEITLRDPDGKLLYQRTNPLEIEGVPGWFIHAIDLHPAAGHAEIVAGWMPTGTIRVVSHPGYAYAQLWDSFVNLLIIFAGIGGLAMLIAWGYLNMLLRPLKAMVRQAEAIVQKRYLFQENLPSTLELRRVVEAMNTMVARLKAIFEREARINERLQKMAYGDDATGLGNRAYFEMVFESVLTDETDPYPGAMAIVHLDGLQAINARHGYPTGTRMVQAISEALQERTRLFPGCVLARLNGSDFAVLAPQSSPARLAAALESLEETFDQIRTRLGIELGLGQIHAGVTDYVHCETRADVLARANSALGTARDQDRFLYLVLAHAEANDALVNSVVDAITHQRLTLLAQPATDKEGGHLHDLELLSQLQDERGDPIPARQFVPLLVELELETTFDRLVMEKVTAWLKAHTPPAPLAINLTPSALNNQDFQQWLLSHVPQEQAASIAFEIPEHFLKSWPEACETFIQRARDAGCLIGFDHFGRQLSEKATLRRYQPDYIKLPLGFSDALRQQDEKTLSYLASLIEMAHNLDIEVIATGIEDQQLLDAYEELGVRWFQGYHLHKPDRLDNWLKHHD